MSISNQNSEYDLEVWTEGKSDWKILKKAFSELGTSLNVKFHEFEGDMGHDKLVKRCDALSDHEHPKPIVFVFDHDNKQIIAQVMEKEKLFKSWDNNVFSFAIPIPEHRLEHENISIELYFSDQELGLCDNRGRRLFLTSEFNAKSGNLKDDSSIHIGNKAVLTNCAEANKAKIVDSDVFNSSNNNIALTKGAFAEYVMNNTPPFDDLKFESFQTIIDILETIKSVSRPKTSVYFPSPEEIFQTIAGLPTETKAARIAKTIYDISYMALEIFSIVSIRCYESQITTGLPEKYAKKARSIKTVLSENFTFPNLKSFVELGRVCYHIVDRDAPQKLLDMKADMEKAEALGEIGNFLEDLQSLIPPKPGTPIYIEKHKLNRNFLEFIAPELAQYESFVVDELEGLLNATQDNVDYVTRWQGSLVALMSRLDALFTNTLSLRLIENYDPEQRTYIANTRMYKDNQVNVVQEPLHEEEDFERKATDMVLPEGKTIHLYPFLVIKDDRLYFYRKTKGEKGYIYDRVFGDWEHLEITKKKFNHAVFKTGSQQDLYWTDVLPTINPINGIRANIPEDRSKFIGRIKQKKIILEEILEIPNQNGILFGPGGIGKTALMLQLAKRLYEESNLDEIMYKNIIWISAKTDFYDYVFGAVEKRPAQYRSLDQILQAILEFFELSNLDEYSLEEKKYLTLETLKENKILLVLDNFETVPPEEVDKIVKFFDIEVKRELRKKPEYFKVIITSRRQIPCGFHQIELRGLDYKESVKLMDNLYEEKYENAASPMLEAQQKSIYETTKGIPIVIKHCFAKMFEYNEPLSFVLSSLDEASEIVQFSFHEILQQIEVKDKDKIRLRILILLELFNYPLTTSQIAKILQEQQIEIDRKISLLEDYQCLSRVYEEGYEKYRVNDEIKLLTRGLTQEHSDITKSIRNLITTNFSIEEQFNYTKEEAHLIEVFNNYLSQRDFLEAEKFIKDQIKEKQNSVILNYHYAKYLKERKRDMDQAISVLEKIRERSNNNPKILLLLIDYYANQAIPNFDKGAVYADQIEVLDLNEDAKIELARFYTHWSTSLKMKIGGDPFEERLRQNKYKELAVRALDILENTSTRDHAIYYLLAQCYFNSWDNKTALKMINKAIEVAEKQGDFSQVSYEKFKERISEKRKKFKD